MGSADRRKYAEQRIVKVRQAIRVRMFRENKMAFYLRFFSILDLMNEIYIMISLF